MIRVRAFANITTIRGTGDSSGAMVTAEYKLVASDGSPAPGTNSVVLTFGYSDNAEGIHQALADLIRDTEANQDIVVTFLDGH